MSPSIPAAAFLAAIVPLVMQFSCGAPVDQKAEPTTSDALTESSTAALRPDMMLRLVLQLEGDHLKVISRTEAPNTLNRRDPDRRSASFFRLVDRDGKIIEERGFRLETSRRSETMGPDGEMEGRRVEVSAPVFSVAVPIVDGLETIRFYVGSMGDERGEARSVGEVKP